MDLTRSPLDNGLQILLHETHEAPVASFWLYYRVGSRNERPGQTGISHWVEHMLFNGTDQFPQGAFDKAMARAGGLFNGMTSQDWTTYFETFPSDRFELALQVESDRMANAVFQSEEIDAERSIILSELEGSENSDYWRLNREVQATAFLSHSYGHPVIGWKDDLHTIRRDDLYRHYQTFYTPNNAVAVAVGDFDTQEVLEKIEGYFGPVPSGPQAPPVLCAEPKQQSERRVLLHGADPTAYLILGLKAPAADHRDFFPLMLLDAILSGSKGMGLFGGSSNNRSNRLYRSLVGPQLAVEVESSYLPTIDPFLFSFYAVLAPKVEHQRVEDVIWSEIEKIQREGVSEAELTKATKQTKAQFAFSNESVTNRAYWIGFSELVASTHWLDTWLQKLSAVQTDDIQRVAIQYFNRHQQTVGWYVPTQNGGE